jgi:hypothetical protein
LLEDLLGQIDSSTGRLLCSNFVFLLHGLPFVPQFQYSGQFVIAGGIRRGSPSSTAAATDAAFSGSSAFASRGTPQTRAARRQLGEVLVGTRGVIGSSRARSVALHTVTAAATRFGGTTSAGFPAAAAHFGTTTAAAPRRPAVGSFFGGSRRNVVGAPALRALVVVRRITVVDFLQLFQFRQRFRCLLSACRLATTARGGRGHGGGF